MFGFETTAAPCYEGKVFRAHATFIYAFRRVELWLLAQRQYECILILMYLRMVNLMRTTVCLPFFKFLVIIPHFALFS